MIEEMRPLLERFSEDEQTISELQGADPEATKDLTHRRSALEEEMMRKIEGYQPV